MTTLRARPVAAPPTPRAPRGRIAGLDGLRGVAASFVVLHHIYLLAYPGYPRSTGPAWCSWLIYGHFAVAVFIVLSGFSLAVGPARAGWRVTDIRRFFRRRAWRILPTYWPALVFSLVVAWTITPQPGEAAPGLKSVVVNGLLVQDILGAPTPNGAFWSIPIEVQLYFAFPLLILLARRLGATAMTAAATAAVVVEGLAAPHVHLAHQLLRVTPQFAALFAMGVGAAGILRSARRQRVVPVAVMVALAPVATVIAVQGSSWTLTHLFWVDLALGPSIALFVAAVASGVAPRSARLLDSLPLRRLGAFSYTLYLVHAPIVVAVYHLVTADRFGHGTDAFLVTLAIAAPLTLLLARAFAAVFEFPFTSTGSWTKFRARYLRPSDEPETEQPIRILTFHGIGPPERELEPGEAGTWVTVEQFELVLDAVAGRSDVRLAFDDGNASDVDVALPRLLDRGLRAQFFVCAGLLGRPGRLDSDDVRALLRAGMTIGSHGWSHTDWRSMDESAAELEIDRARRVLRRIAGYQIDDVAVPFGSYDRVVLRRLRRAGISRVYTSDGGRARPGAWVQQRTSVPQTVDKEWVTRVLAEKRSARAVARGVAARTAKRHRGRPGWSSPAPAPGAARPAIPVGTTPRLAAVIVTYRSREVLPGCLESLRAAAAGVDLRRIVVADNGSNDDLASIAAGFADLPVEIRGMGRNGGYAAGINGGLDALDLAELDGVVVLNPDCRLHAGALAALAAALGEPGRGIAVPKLVNPDGSLQPTLRRRPAIHRALAESLLGRSAGRLGLGELVTGRAAHERPGAWAWATGAAMLLSTAMLEDVGPWDESFFLFSEETEFALRAADRGWRLWYEPAAVVTHIGGESHRSPRFAALIARNRVRLHWRRHGPVRGAAYLAVAWLGEAARGLLRPSSRAAARALTRPVLPVRGYSEEAP